MTLYKAKKEGIEFYIQPDMLAGYAAKGSTVVKLEDTEITDVAAEVEAAGKECVDTNARRNCNAGI